MQKVTKCLAFLFLILILASASCDSGNTAKTGALSGGKVTYTYEAVTPQVDQSTLVSREVKLTLGSILLRSDWSSIQEGEHFEEIRFYLKGQEFAYQFAGEADPTELGTKMHIHFQCPDNQTFMERLRNKTSPSYGYDEMLIRSYFFNVETVESEFYITVTQINEKLPNAAIMWFRKSNWAMTWMKCKKSELKDFIKQLHAAKIH